MGGADKQRGSATSGGSGGGLGQSARGNPLTAQVSDMTDGVPDLLLNVSSFDCAPSARSQQLPATHEEHPF